MDGEKRRHSCPYLPCAGRVQHRPRHQGAHLFQILGPHPLRGHARGADPDPRGDGRGLGIVRDHVAVERDARRRAPALRFGPRHPDPAQVDQRQVGVRATRHRPHPLHRQRLRQRPRVHDHLPGVTGELRPHRLAERHRLGRHHVHQRPALHEREHRPVDPPGQLLRAQDGAAARPAQRLVRGERHNIRVRDRRRDRAAGHQPDRMCHVGQQPSAHLVRDAAKRRIVDEPRVRGRAAHDELRLMAQCQVAHLVVVDEFGVATHAVRHDVEPSSREIHLRAVGEVAAVRERHGQHGVAGLQQRGIGGQVRRGARMGLHVGVLGPEQLARPVDRQPLGPVDDLAAAVVAPARVALGVLVGQGGAQGGHDGRRGEVLARDQLDAAAYPVELVDQDPGDLGIPPPQHPEVRTVVGLRTHFPTVRPYVRFSHTSVMPGNLISCRPTAALLPNRAGL